MLLHADGGARLWQLDFGKLLAARDEWKRMLGLEQLEVEEPAARLLSFC